MTEGQVEVAAAREIPMTRVTRIALGGKDPMGSSSLDNQTTSVAGRHFGSNPTRPSERYETTAASADSLNQARLGVWISNRRRLER